MPRTSALLMEEGTVAASPSGLVNGDSQNEPVPCSLASGGTRGHCRTQLSKVMAGGCRDGRPRGGAIWGVVLLQRIWEQMKSVSQGP